MAITQIRGSQVRNETLKNVHIALDAAVQLVKLETPVLAADGRQEATANISLGDFKLTNVGAAELATDAPNYKQVQDLVAGLKWKNQVRVATLANISLEGVQTIDGVSLVVDDSVLVKNQTNPAENGIYLVKEEQWERRGDADNSPNDELTAAAVLILSGSQASTAWTVNSTVTTINVDPVNWVQFNGAAAITAGDGMTKTGNQLDVVASATGGLSVAPDSVSIKLATFSALNTTSDGLAVDASIAGDALLLTDGVLDVVAAANGGLEVAADAIQVKLASASGLNTDSSGLYVGSSSAIDVVANAVSVKLATNSGLNTTSGLAVDASIAGDALLLTDGVLDVKVKSDAGIQVTADELDLKLVVNGGLSKSASGLTVVGSSAIDISEGVTLKLATNSGLNTTSGLAVDASIAGDALLLTDGVLDVKVASTGSLQITSDELSVKLQNNSGLVSTADGLALNAAGIAGNGLDYTNGVLSLNISSTGGLEIVEDNLAIKLATNSGLSLDANGLSLNMTSVAGDGISVTDGVLSIDFVSGEVATTTDDTVYTIANAPVAGTLQVYLNGQLQRVGGSYDYTTSGTSVTFNSANTSVDVVMVSYFK
jgi:hypothetical protein